MKEKIRKVFEFLKATETGHDKHGNNGYVVLSGKKYFVGKMSYDEWYLQHYVDWEGLGEFTDKCLWEKGDTTEILDMFEKNNLIKVIVN